MSTGYVCTGKDLILLAILAEVKGYNAQLDKGKLLKLNEDAFVLLPVMLHEHVAGVAQPPENCQMRCMVHVNREGAKVGPYIGNLDVQIGVWKRCVESAVPLETANNS
jgi:hypothetical protein